MKMFLFAVGCISLLISTLISASVHYYQARAAQDRAENISSEAVFGINRYTERIIVQSVDPTTRTLVGLIRVPGVPQRIPMVFELHPDSVIKRRNAIIRNDTIVGTSSTTAATLDDLVEGTHGFGVVGRNTNTGVMELSYLIIGDPFPRP